jgi:hypothetical protein
MNIDSTKPDIANAEQPQLAPVGLFAVTSMTILAGVMSGVGAFIGGTIGKNDGFSHSKLPLGIIGMLLVSSAMIWIISPKWRRGYIAALPMFWLILGGTMVMPFFVSPEDFPTANSVVVAMGLLFGMPAGGHIMKRR